MGMTIDEAIGIITAKGNYSYTVIENKAKDVLVDTARKYQMMRVDYEIRLKADMVAMLTELSMTIGEIEDGYTEFDEENKRSLTMIPLESIDGLIQQKINELKTESEE